MDGTRLERERTFHNAAFAGDARAAAGQFYSVTDSSRSRYLDLLDQLGGGRRVLEYGCGTGSYSFWLAQRGARVAGIDISDGAIAMAEAEAVRREMQGRVQFHVMNAEALDFRDESFDLVCGTGILHHLDVRRSFSEIARVLAPDGTAVFLEPLGHNPVINAFRRATPSMRTPDEHPLVRDDFTLATAFFGKVATEHFHLQSLAAFPLRRAPGFKLLVRALDAADALLFRAVPATRHLAWRAVVRLSQPYQRVSRPAPRADVETRTMAPATTAAAAR